MNNIMLIHVDEENEQFVGARALHKKLEVKKRFSEWFKTNSKKFVEGVDFMGVLGGTPIENGNGRIQHLDDYSLSLDMAKHIALMSGTEKGAEVRTYFIEAEKKLKQAMNRPLTTQEQIALIAKGNGELSEQVELLDQRVNELDGNQVLSSARYDYVSKFVNRKVREYAEVHGLDYKEHVGALRQDLSRQILDITGVRVRRDLRDKHFDSVVDLIENWTPSTATVFKIKQTVLEV